MQKDKIGCYQVAAPKATINRKRVIKPHQFFILGPNEVSSETYSVIHSFENISEAKNFLEYLKTNFVRYFFGIRKISQNISKKTWSYVPLMDCRDKAWTDKELFEYFNITEKEKNHIIEQVEKWTV